MDQYLLHRNFYADLFVVLIPFTRVTSSAVHRKVQNGIILPHGNSYADLFCALVLVLSAPAGNVSLIFVCPY